MRRLQPPTLAQWGCIHRWKTTTSRPGANGVVRVRYLTCRRCGLRVKTEERLTVPWDVSALVRLVKAVLPEGRAVYLREQGITELPLHRLNSILAQQGLVIHAAKVRDRKRFVACTDKDGRVEPYGLFELRHSAREVSGRTNRKHQRGGLPLRDQGRAGRRERRSR